MNGILRQWSDFLSGPGFPATGGFVAAVLLLLAVSEALRRALHLRAEFSRKMVHIGTGFIVFFAPHWITHGGPVMALGVLFTFVNLLAYRRHWLEAVHRNTRNSHGTAYYPFALFLLASVAWNDHVPLVIAGMLVMALGDGLAGIAGELLPRPVVYRLTSSEKSLEGSLVMFLGSFAALLLTWLGFSNYDGFVRFIAAHGVPMLVACFAAVALFATAWEAVSSRGTDNLTVPVMTAFALALCLWPSTTDGVPAFLTASLLGLAIALVSVRLHFLTASGAVATYILAAVIWGVGGFTWTAPILAFFILSSILSKVGRSHEPVGGSVAEKSHTRDLWQVLANGGLAGLLAMGSQLLPHPAWYAAFLGAVAAVTADTWSTETGMLSGHTPRSILTMAPVERGISGGITAVGTLGGTLGAATIALIAHLAGGLTGRTFLAITIGGAVGNLADSFFGALVQVRLRCTVCHASTERSAHCGRPTEHAGGLPWVTNDVVNILCACSGAAVAVLLLHAW